MTTASTAPDRAFTIVQSFLPGLKVKLSIQLNVSVVQSISIQALQNTYSGTERSGHLKGLSKDEFWLACP